MEYSGHLYLEKHKELAIIMIYSSLKHKGMVGLPMISYTTVSIIGQQEGNTLAS